MHLAIAVAIASYFIANEMRAQVVMNGLFSYWGCDEADIKGDAEIFGGLRHDSAGGELVNLDAHIEESRIYSAVLDQEP